LGRPLGYGIIRWPRNTCSCALNCSLPSTHTLLVTYRIFCTVENSSYLYDLVGFLPDVGKLDTRLAGLAYGLLLPISIVLKLYQCDEGYVSFRIEGPRVTKKFTLPLLLQIFAMIFFRNQ
jgi:hypothetical protein